VCDSTLNMYVTDNAAGLWLPNKIITVYSDDRRIINIFCGETAELLHVKLCRCASNGYSILFPAKNAVRCSILSSLYMS
jgi:hypothetical protein